MKDKNYDEAMKILNKMVLSSSEHSKDPVILEKLLVCAGELNRKDTVVELVLQLSQEKPKLLEKYSNKFPQEPRLLFKILEHSQSEKKFLKLADTHFKLARHFFSEQAYDKSRFHFLKAKKVHTSQEYMGRDRTNSLIIEGLVNCYFRMNQVQKAINECISFAEETDIVQEKFRWFSTARELILGLFKPSGFGSRSDHKKKEEEDEEETEGEEILGSVKKGNVQVNEEMKKQEKEITKKIVDLCIANDMIEELERCGVLSDDDHLHLEVLKKMKKMKFDERAERMKKYLRRYHECDEKDTKKRNELLKLANDVKSETSPPRKFYRLFYDDDHSLEDLRVCSTNQHNNYEFGHSGRSSNVARIISIDTSKEGLNETPASSSVLIDIQIPHVQVLQVGSYSTKLPPTKTIFGSSFVAGNLKKLEFHKLNPTDLLFPWKKVAPSLKHLRFTGCTTVTDDDLMKCFFPRLEHFCCYSNEFLTGKCLQHMPNLKIVSVDSKNFDYNNLKYTRYVEEIDCKKCELVVKFPQLKKISVGSGSLDLSADYMVNKERMSFSGTELKFDSSADRIDYVHLDYLWLSSIRGVPFDLSVMFCPKLTSFSCSYYNLLGIPNGENITSISLSNVNSDFSLLAAQNLKSLSLSSCSGITGQGISVLLTNLSVENCPSLEEGNLEHLWFVESVTMKKHPTLTGNSFSRMKSLTDVNISECEKFCYNFRENQNVRRATIDELSCANVDSILKCLVDNSVHSINIPFNNRTEEDLSILKSVEGGEIGFSIQLGKYSGVEYVSTFGSGGGIERVQQLTKEEKEKIKSIRINTQYWKGTHDIMDIMDLNSVNVKDETVISDELVVNLEKIKRFGLLQSAQVSSKNSMNDERNIFGVSFQFMSYFEFLRLRRVDVKEEYFNFPNIKEIMVSTCDGFSGIGLKNMNSLEKLVILKCDDFFDMGYLPSLKYLRVSRCKKFAGHFGNKFPSLRRVNVANCPVFGQKSGGRVHNLPRLRELDVDLCPNFDDSQLNMPDLRYFWCNEGKSLTGNGIKKSAKTLVHLLVFPQDSPRLNLNNSTFTSLKTLILHDCSGFHDSSGLVLPELLQVTLKNCTHLKGKIFERSKKLRKMDLEGLEVFDDSNFDIETLELVRLIGRTSAASVTGDGFKNSKYLKFLEVKNCPNFKKELFGRVVRLELE